MGNTFTAQDIIQLPRFTGAGAIALGERLLSAAKPHKKALNKSITKALGLVADTHVALKGTLQQQFTPPEAPVASDADKTLADRRIDACWSALLDYLSAWSKLPDVPQAADAGAMKAQIFTDGLKFTQLPYDLEWSQSDLRVGVIKTQGLDKRIGKLGGQVFLDKLFGAHEAYGKVLGLTEAKAEEVKIMLPNVREATAAFATAVRSYVTKVVASVEADEPETQVLADALLAPIAAWNIGFGTTVGAKGGDAGEGEAAAGEAATKETDKDKEKEKGDAAKPAGGATGGGQP